jgi:hypothetical protein
METPPSPNTVPLLSTQYVPRSLTIRAHPRSTRRANKTTVIIRYVCTSCGQLLGQPRPRPITGSRSSGATRNFGWESLRNVTQVPRAQLNSSQLRRRRHTANIALVAALEHRSVELGTHAYLIHTPRYRNRCLDVTVSRKQSSLSPHLRQIPHSTLSLTYHHRYLRSLQCGGDRQSGVYARHPVTLE